MKFIHEDFLLGTRTARRLFHQFAETEKSSVRSAMFIVRSAPRLRPSSVGAACACAFIPLHWRTKPNRSSMPLLRSLAVLNYALL